MWTRRIFLQKGVWSFLIGSFFSLSRLLSDSWARAKEILPKGFAKNKIIQMNPAEVNNRNLEIDPLDLFGNMGPTDIQVDPTTYRLKVVGKVEKSLSLSLNQITQLPSVTGVVLLICPGVFANNGRWTGVALQTLVQPAQVKKGAQFIDIKGAQGKTVRVPIKEANEKRVFLAYQVNGEILPQKHGFPLRLVLEGHYGSEWVKYVEEIEVS